jgi:serine/threonine-protein kinase Chk2
VKDLETTYGTEVTYDGQGHGKRSGFVWIIGGHALPDSRQSIVININNILKFQVVVQRQERTSPLYVDNVNRFWQGTAGAETLPGRLNERTRPYPERGDDLAEDDRLARNWQVWGGEDSEAQMAARLLRAMREES